MKGLSELASRGPLDADIRSRQGVHRYNELAEIVATEEIAAPQ